MSVVTKKPTVATVWLDGCSGCHMSLLDLDERLITLAGLVDVVYSPVVDDKQFPAKVDLTLIEGAVSSEEDYRKARMIRTRSGCVMSLGDCAVTGNVPTMRNCFDRSALFERAYVENAAYPADADQRRLALPVLGVPALRPKALPVHEVIKVDVFLPGCPPPADAIWFVLSEILAGRKPTTTDVSRFGR